MIVSPYTQMTPLQKTDEPATDTEYKQDPSVRQEEHQCLIFLENSTSQSSSRRYEDKRQQSITRNWRNDRHPNAVRALKRTAYLTGMGLALTGFAIGSFLALSRQHMLEEVK